MTTNHQAPDDRIDLFELRKGEPWSATKRETLATDRPVIIYFPGLGHFNDLKVSHEVMHKMQRFVSEYFYGEEFKQTNPVVYLARRSQSHTSSMEKMQLQSHAVDEAHTSPTAYQFVDAYLAPLLPNLSDSHHKDADFHTAQLAMSRLLLAGHSLGTSYIQQIRNALEQHLEKKGYNENQTEAVLNSLAGLSLSDTIPLFGRGKKDMPTLHMTLDGDKVAMTNDCTPDIITVEDTHPHLAVAKAGTHLYLMPRYKGEHRIRSAKLIPLHQDTDRKQIASRLDIRDETGKPRVQWVVETCERADHWGHDPRSLLNVTQPINPSQFTFQSNAGADIVQAYVAECLNASRGAAEKGIARDTTAILQQIENEKLTEAGRELSNNRAQSGLHRFAELLRFSHHYPANGSLSR